MGTSTNGRGGAGQGRRQGHPQSQTAGIASRGVRTPAELCALGSAMLSDVANATIGHKEVQAYARGASVMMGSARIGAQLGFDRDLLAGGCQEAEAEQLAEEEADLRARLADVQRRREARDG